MTGAGLSGVRMLDLGRYQAGPRCAFLFRDLGAEVIKVEPPGGEESRKRVSVSGYGDDSPYRDRPAFDPVGQAISGLMTMTGFPDSPPTLTYAPVIDRVTALHATIGALAALRHRDRHGTGQRVEVSLLDSGISLMEIPLTSTYLNGVEPPRRGNTPGGTNVAPANTYRARDGWVFLIVLGDSLWSRFCTALGVDGLAADPRFSSNTARAEHRDEIDRHVAVWVAERTVDEVVAVLSAAEVPAFPVQTLRQVLDDEHVWKRQLLVRVDDPVAGEMLVPGFPIRLSAVPREIAGIPTPGQHNAEIFGSLLGADDRQLAEWSAKGII